MRFMCVECVPALQLWISYVFGVISETEGFTMSVPAGTEARYNQGR